jgi:hypothetical protein
MLIYELGLQAVVFLNDMLLQNLVRKCLCTGADFLLCAYYKRTVETEKFIVDLSI